MEAKTSQNHEPAAPAMPAIPEDLYLRLLASHRSLLVSRLAAPAAHEIINPLSASVNLASLLQHILKDDGIPASRVPESREYLRLIAGESARAGRYASELLAFARASNRKQGRIYINELVRQTQSLISHLLKMEGVALDIDLSDDEAPSSQGDASELQQAVLNLIINSIEAMEGMPERRITVATREIGGAISLMIRDTGKGIPAENLQRIFDPFFTTGTRPENLGLGLTIARAIVERHHGTLEVESVPGTGTTVIMRLSASLTGEQQ